jgi:Protein of unknown function (DUF1566)
MNQKRSHSNFIVLMAGFLLLALPIGSRAGEAKSDTTWTDSATGLMWTGHDSGENLTWSHAKSYCTDLRLGSYSSWRMPTIDELTGISDQTEEVNGYHIKGGINISGPGSSVWSSSAGQISGYAMAFFFPTGARTSFPYTYSARALCVRRSTE